MRHQSNTHVIHVARCTYTTLCSRPKYFEILIIHYCMHCVMRKHLRVVKPNRHKPSEDNKKLKLPPIGIGMVWPKIISKWILNHYHPYTKDFFEPFHFGLSKSGLESITHITKEALQQHPNWVLLRLDLVNAFNTILRKIIFQEVQEHFPFLLPWLCCLYGQSSNLWTKSEDGTFYFPLSSEEGVKQGCTLGSFLFCLAICAQ